MKKLLSGNEALARGALEARIEIACGYPGTPSSEILENVSKYKEIYSEWSVNEKVAMDAAAGAAARDGSAMGDVVAVARIAGIAAAKKVPDLLPLAHTIGVHGAAVDIHLEKDHVAITATVRTADRTGVEMEALTAVTVAALAVVDMVKGVDRSAAITDCKIIHKAGGRSGDWHRPGYEG